MIHTLLNVTGVVAESTGGSVVYPKRGVNANASGEGLVQVQVDGTATVTIEGRMTSSSDWETVDTAAYANSGTATRVAIFPQMRATLTAVDATKDTPSTGTISMSSNPDNLDPTLVAVNAADAVLSAGVVNATDVGTSGDTIVINDGTTSTTFEVDATGVEATATVQIDAGLVEGDAVQISDVAGNVGLFWFYDTLANVPVNAIGVEIGTTTESATNLKTAINAEWAANRLDIEADSSSNSVTLVQTEFGTSVDDIEEYGNYPTKDTTTTGFTLTQWASAVALTTVTSNIPIAIGASAAALKINVNRAIQNQIYKKTLLLTLSSIDADSIAVTHTEAGVHHNAGASGFQSGAAISVTGSGDFTRTDFTGGTSGTNGKILEINEASETSGYTHIDATNGNTVGSIMEAIVDELDSASWGGGTLDATSNYDEASVTIKSVGDGLTGYANESIVIVSDPHSLLTVTGMSGGVEGASALVHLDTSA